MKYIIPQVITRTYSTFRNWILFLSCELFLMLLLYVKMIFFFCSFFLLLATLLLIICPWFPFILFKFKFFDFVSCCEEKAKVVKAWGVKAHLLFVYLMIECPWEVKQNTILCQAVMRSIEIKICPPFAIVWMIAIF